MYVILVFGICISLVVFGVSWGGFLYIGLIMMWNVLFFDLFGGFWWFCNLKIKEFLKILFLKCL